MKPSPTKVASRWKQAAPDLDGMLDSVLYFQDGIDLDEIDFNGHFRWNHTPALREARAKIHDAMFDYERALRDAHAEEEARLAKIEQERLEEERREKERREAEKRLQKAQDDFAKEAEALMRKEVGKDAKVIGDLRSGVPAVMYVRWKEPLTTRAMANIRRPLMKALARRFKDSRYGKPHPEGDEFYMDDLDLTLFMSTDDENPNHSWDSSWQIFGVMDHIRG